jgi:hypothetical protein
MIRETKYKRVQQINKPQNGLTEKSCNIYSPDESEERKEWKAK